MRIVYLGEAGAASAVLAVLLRLSREHAGTLLSHFLCGLALITAGIIVLMIRSHNLLDQLAPYVATAADVRAEVIDELPGATADEIAYWTATKLHLQPPQPKNEGNIIHVDFSKPRSPRREGTW